MVGTVHGLGAQPPGPVCEHDDEEEKEGPYDFKENDVSHSAERLEESAHPPGDVSGGLTGGTAGHPSASRALDRVDDDGSGNGAPCRG